MEGALWIESALCLILHYCGRDDDDAESSATILELYKNQCAPTPCLGYMHSMPEILPDLVLYSKATMS